jgi:feruloyl esterase
MDHGIPLDPGTGAGQSGQAGAYMLDVGLSSTDRIAAFFGIGAQAEPRVQLPRVADIMPEAKRAKPARKSFAKATAQPVGRAPAHGVQKVIEDALRAAGLMR